MLHDRQRKLDCRDSRLAQCHPRNYAKAWHDNPTQFSEFETLARFAGKAANSNLRDEGRHLASAVSSHNTAAVGTVMGDIFATV